MPAVWAFLAFIILCAITYSQEMSLFANFDLMSIGTTVNFAEGKGTGISDIRFSPFGNVELNLFYAVSHNMYIVSGMVLGETALLLYLFYRLFDFIPRFCDACMPWLLAGILSGCWSGTTIRFFRNG